MSLKTVILVCTSNTCRSPMAEYHARKWFEERGVNDVKVMSRALTDAYEPPGSPASENGIIVMKQDFGIDMSAHRSALLQQSDIDTATAIIGVSGSHVAYIDENFTVNPNILHTMSENVSDPWHAPIEVYRACAHQLAKLVPSKLSDIFEK